MSNTSRCRRQQGNDNRGQQERSRAPAAGLRSKASLKILFGVGSTQLTSKRSTAAQMHAEARPRIPSSSTHTHPVGQRVRGVAHNFLEQLSWDAGQGRSSHSRCLLLLLLLLLSSHRYISRLLAMMQTFKPSRRGLALLVRPPAGNQQQRACGGTEGGREGAVCLQAPLGPAAGLPQQPAR